MTNSQRELLAYLAKPRTTAEVMRYLSVNHAAANRRLSALHERGHAKIIRQGAGYLYEAKP